MTHVSNPSTQEVRYRIQKFMIVLNYIVNLRPSWNNREFVSIKRGRGTGLALMCE